MTDPTYRNPPTVDDEIIDAIAAIAFIGAALTLSAGLVTSLLVRALRRRLAR